MRLSFIVIIILSFSSLSFSQGKIYGLVSSSGKPVEFASVYIRELQKGDQTDDSGKFSFTNIEYGKFQIEISFVGFQKYTQTVVLNELKPEVQFNVELLPLDNQLDDVVVSGTMVAVSRKNSPVPVEVYSSKYFEANPTPSLFESMQNINGVRPQLNCNICNTGDIHINGLEGPYTMVLIDGMPIVSGLSSVYGLTGIPQSLIERVEIVKGPASTLYGSEAVGGLINVITKDPSKSPKATLNVYSTTWQEYNFDLGYRFNAGEKVNSLIGLNYFNYTNPIDNNSDGFTDVTLQNRISIFNKWSLQRKNNRKFIIAGRYNYEDRWGGEMSWRPEFRGGDSVYGESIYTKRWELIGDYQLPIKELVNLQISSNGHNQNSVYGNISYRAQQNISFGQMVWKKNIDYRNELLLGTSLRYTYYDDNTPATEKFDTINQPANMPSEIYIPGLFIQNEYRISPSNKLLLGLRYDHNSKHGAIFSPRFNCKWNSDNERNILRISLGNGFRVANIFTEDHAALTGARKVVFVSELQPERSWNANINFVKSIFDIKNSFLDIDASVFYTYFQNKIIANYDINPNEIVYDNLSGYSISRGFALNLNWSFTNGLNISSGITAQDVFIVNEGKKQSQVLTEKISGVWNINYSISKLGLSFDYTGNIYSPMRLPVLGPLDERAEISPWWSIQNIQITKKIKNGFDVYFGIKNLLNYTPPANSIARSFDPFDKNVNFDANGNAIADANNPNALTFDPTYVFAPNQGIRGFTGLRFIFK